MKLSTDAVSKGQGRYPSQVPDADLFGPSGWDLDEGDFGQIHSYEDPAEGVYETGTRFATPFQLPNAVHKWIQARSVLMAMAILERPLPTLEPPTTPSTPYGQPTTELTALANHVLTPNWDGLEAPALDPQTFDYAKEFMANLSASVEGPEVDATAQGEIVFSWDSEDSDDTFDVAMCPDGRLALAGIFGEIELKGSVDAHSKKVMSRVHDLIRWTMQ